MYICKSFVIRRYLVKRKILYSLLTVILFAGGFAGGYHYGKNSQPSIEKITGIQNLQQGQPLGVDFSLFWDAWAKVQEKFVNRDKLDNQQMIYGAIAGMLSALKDPYTVFMTPEENKEFSQAMQGNFEGIGAEIGIRKSVLTIISPLEGTPAKKAGLMAGDKILKINDEITAGMSVEEAVSRIRGPKGTEVRLTIVRDGWDTAKEIKITREVINIPIIKLEMKEVNGKTVARLILYHFTENSTIEFEKAARQILTSKAQGIILDLRDNPGGYLESAVEIASWFLPEGKLVVAEDFGNGKKDEHFSEGINKLAGYQTVILINQGSASASEILAGALRDNLNIKLIGEKSFGKGSVQQLEQMSNGTSLKITVAKWLTPSGHSIMEEGLEPDVKVELKKEDIEENRDPQLEKALELFK